jgi:hypothetical protein
MTAKMEEEPESVPLLDLDKRDSCDRHSMDSAGHTHHFQGEVYVLFELAILYSIAEV